MSLWYMDKTKDCISVVDKPKKSPNKNTECTYFGDGVYGVFDGYGLELRANDHQDPTDIIYLEPAVLKAINNFMNKQEG